MALHSRDAVTVSAAVATQSRADCSSMEGHTSLSTALVQRMVINRKEHQHVDEKIVERWNETKWG